MTRAELTSKYGVTPGRKTSVVLDGPELVRSRKPFALSRKLAQIGADGSERAGVQFFGLLGWELECIQASGQTETSDVEAAIMKLGTDLTAISNVETVSTVRSPSDLTGATTGAVSGLIDSGSGFLQQQIPAGGSFADGLPYDPLGSSHGRPTYNTSTQIFAMKSLVATVAQCDPNRALIFRFRLPPFVSSTNLILRLFMNGPSSEELGAFTGFGLYCVSFFGDGKLVWHEYGQDQSLDGHPKVWREKWNTQRWYDGQPSADEIYAFYFRPLLLQRKKKPAGGAFVAAKMPIQAPQERPSAGSTSRVTDTDSEGGTSAILNVPTSGPGTGGAIDRLPILVEVATPYRVAVQLSRAIYKLSGTIKDAPFILTSWDLDDADTAIPVIVNWESEVPNNTTISVQMYRKSDNASLTVFAPTSDYPDAVNQKMFKLPSDKAGDQAYYLKWTLTTTDKTVTPLLKRYDVYRDGKNLMTDPASGGVTLPIVTGSFATQFLNSVSTTGAGQDLSHESAQVELTDTDGSLDLLRNRGDVPILIKTTVPSDDEDEESVLFRGLMTRADWHPYGATPGDYPSNDGGKLSLTCSGMYLRLRQMPSPMRFNLGADSLGEPYQITGVLQYLVSLIGYQRHTNFPNTDVLDYPVSGVIGGVETPEQVIEPGADIERFINGLIEENLDWFLTFDPNAAPDGDPDDFLGMFRLLPMATPGSNGFYSPKYAFIYSGDHPGNGDSGESLSHMYNAYDDVTYHGEPVPVTYILKRTFRSDTLPPEANEIVVGGDAALEVGKGNLVQTWFNNASFNFKNTAVSGDAPNPASSVYLRFPKPVYHFDRNLITEERINIVTARMAKKMGTAIKTLTFTAPLVFITDDADDYQCRPRPLRYQDPVLILMDDEQVVALVEAIHIHIEKDNKQFATYECYIPPDLGKTGTS